MAGRGREFETTEELNALEILSSLAAEQPSLLGSHRQTPPGRQGGGRSPGSAIKSSMPSYQRAYQPDDKSENNAPQKWVQCAKCERWRKVPFALRDEDISDDWECSDNSWDPQHNSCRVPQALTDEEIDKILASQAKLEQSSYLHASPMSLADDAERGYDGIDDSGQVFRFRTRTGNSPPNDVESPAANKRGRNGKAGAPKAAANKKTFNSSKRAAIPPVPKGRSRGSKTLTDAAEALLGIASQDIDDLDRDGQNEGAAESQSVLEALKADGARFRPGTIVWGKVEGHVWWPAKVVRRRAVPKEVGPPLGGPQFVRNYIPVIFLTPHGVPPERVPGVSHSNAQQGEVDEAEYAWLLSDCLKAFKTGTEVPVVGSTPSETPTVQSCVEAAKKIVANMEERRTDQQEVLYDSEGGWGLAVQAPDDVAPGRPKGGKGKGRGGKRGRGKARKAGRGNKRGRLEDDLEDSDSDGAQAGADGPDLAATPVSAPKIVVEQILAWRWPLSPAEKASELQKEQEKEAAQIATGRDNHRVAQSKNEIAPSPACVPEEAAVKARQEESASVVEAKNQLAARQGESATDQQDASQRLPESVFAQIQTGNAPVPRPQDLLYDAEQVHMQASNLETSSLLPEYLVKFSKRAHIYNEWVSEDTLMKIAKRKCAMFKRNYPQPVNQMHSEWTIPERLIARRCNPTGPGWEVYVKWTGQSYEDCTWESEEDGVLVKPQYLDLHKQLWRRQKEALRKANPEAESESKSALSKARKLGQELSSQPDYITDRVKLYPHQLQAVNWLRKQYWKNQPGILSDEAGLGKTASVVTFIQSLRHEFKTHKPVLVVVPQASLPFWEGEFEFWAGPDCNVVAFAGTNAARSVIYEHELWLDSKSLDGRTSYNSPQNYPDKVVKADVVIAAHEAVASDNDKLSEISWDMIVVDERKRARSALAKALTGIKNLTCQHRLLLSHSDLSVGSPTTLLQCLSFLKPEIQDTSDVAKHFDKLSEEDQMAKFSSHLKPMTLRRMHSDVSELSESARASKVEIQIPVAFPQDQADFYKQVLSRFYDVLVDPKTHRLSSSRASQSKAICDELRKVVGHPFVIPELAPESETGDENGTASERLAASGKLPILEKMIKHLQATNRQAMLLSQDSTVLDILKEHFTEQFGEDCVERIDDTTSSTERQNCLQRFNKGSGKSFLFMQTVGCCGLGTDLPNVSLVIIHDSDWNPRADIQAISRCHRVGSKEKGTPTLRLFVTGSVEEKLLKMCENVAGMEAVYNTGGGARSLGSSAPLMEEILRWGTQDLFQPRGESDDGKKAVQSRAGSSPPDNVEGNLTLRSEPSQSASVLAYEDEALNTLMEKAIEAGESLEENTNDSLGPGLERVVVRRWQDDLASQEDADGDESNDEDGQDEDGQDGDASEQLLGGSYWANLLGTYTGGLNAKGDGFDRKASRKRNRTEKAAAAFADSDEHMSEADEPEEVNLNGLEYGKALSGHVGDALGEEMAGRRGSGRGSRGGRGGGRAPRGTRRRRPDDDDDASDVFETREKRRKRGPEVDPDYERLEAEFQHHEDIMAAINDSSSQEFRVTQHAVRRLHEIVNEAELGQECLELATQAAKILVIQRDDKEVISEFQDYTLFALVAVGAHLLGADHHPGLYNLTQRYNNGAPDLKGVFEFILASLTKYRAFMKKVVEIREGRRNMYGPETLDRTYRGIPTQNSDIEGFGNRLNDIVNTDYTRQANQTPLDLAQFQLPFMGHDMERVSPHLAKEFDMVQGQLKELTSQIALKDRIHNIRVKCIQEEYQKYMEKVRSKAQTAIDQANSLFQNERNDLTAQVDMLVHLIHSRYILALGGIGNASSQHQGEAERENGDQHRVATNRAPDGSSPQGSPAKTFNAAQAQEVQLKLQDESEAQAMQKVHLNGGTSMAHLQRNVGPKSQAQGFMGGDGKHQNANGGLASMAVQSAHSFAPQQPGGQRQLNQQHSLPLQRLTSEQLADVQQQISSTPPVQSPNLPSNQQATEQAWESMSMFPSFFHNASLKPDQDNQQQIATLQQAYVRAQSAQQAAVNANRAEQMDERANNALSANTGPSRQQNMGSQPPYFSGRPVQIVTARPVGADDAVGRNWDGRSASSHSTPSRSPSPTHPPQQDRAQVPILTGKPISEAQVQERSNHYRQDPPSKDTGYGEDHRTHNRQADHDVQNATMSAAHFGRPVETATTDAYHQRFNSSGTLRDWSGSQQLAAMQSMQGMDKGAFPHKETANFTTIQRSGWPQIIQVLPSQTQTITSGGPMGTIHHGRPIKSQEKASDRQSQKHDNPLPFT